MVTGVHRSAVIFVNRVFNQIFDLGLVIMLQLTETKTAVVKVPLLKLL